MSGDPVMQGELGPGRIGRVAAGDILHRSARRFAGRVAIVDGEKRTTYAELEATANRFAHFLLSQDLKKGSRVATACNNSTEFVACIFGILKAGMVWVPINTMLGVDDARYIVQHSEPALLVVDDDIHAKAERRASFDELAVPLLINTVTGAASPEGATRTFADSLEGQPETEPDVDIDERDIAVIMYTSGTTSRPKGAAHCHLAIVFSAFNNTIEWRLDRDDAISCLLPLFHCAQHAILNYTLLVGAKSVMHRGFDVDALIRSIDRERMTVTILLPMMYAAILDHPRRSEYDLSSLRLCIWGMAPMPRDMTERLVKEICPNFILGSGQTEMYPSTTMSRPDRTLQRFGNYWGESTVVNETAIMDDDGNLLPPGQVGEIVHRGPNAMMGYYKDPTATAESRAFGWHHTGDLAMVDENGEILFIDRKKDLIKSGGENVSSVKVEEALLTHPAVDRAAAVGLPHPRWGEAVAAILVLKPGHSADEASIINHCKPLLGGFQVPKLVRFVDEMPMTASGKVRKAELKRPYLNHYLDT